MSKNERQGPRKPATKFADHLKDGPKSVEELAEATSTNADALYRLLRALASQGVFAKGEPRQFSLTPLAEPLQSDVPGSKRALALMSGDEQFRAWAEIDYSIQTGKIAFEKVYGKPIFDYFVVESVIPPGNEPFGGKSLDLVMLLIPGGKERTEDEYRALLDKAGFELTRVVPTGTEVGIIEGMKT